jgi:hypothetical protein
MYVRTYVCIYVCMYVSMYVCMYLYMYVSVYAHMHVCVYLYMYVCMHACKGEGHVSSDVCTATYRSIVLLLGDKGRKGSDSATGICGESLNPFTLTVS